MTCEQLINRLQDLISKGTISPHADICVRVSKYGECYCGKEVMFDETLEIVDDVELCSHETSYNKLVLI